MDKPVHADKFMEVGKYYEKQEQYHHKYCRYPLYHTRSSRLQYGHIRVFRCCG